LLELLRLALLLEVGKRPLAKFKILVIIIDTFLWFIWDYIIFVIAVSNKGV